MTAAELLRLAQRVEALVKSDRTIDQDIHQTVVLKQPLDERISPYCKKYTSSIDDAMSLVPKGFWLDIETGTQEHAPDFRWPIVAIGKQSARATLWKGQAVTLAITICAAAIRALAAQADGVKQ